MSNISTNFQLELRFIYEKYLNFAKGWTTAKYRSTDIAKVEKIEPTFKVFERN